MYVGILEYKFRFPAVCLVLLLFDQVGDAVLRWIKLHNVVFSCVHPMLSLVIEGGAGTGCGQVSVARRAIRCRLPL